MEVEHSGERGQGRIMPPRLKSEASLSRKAEGRSLQRATAEEVVRKVVSE